MRPFTLASTLAATMVFAPLVVAVATGAHAEDNQAGTTLTPADAAGPWTLESAGRSLCVVTLGKEKAGSGYAVQVPAACHEFIPSPAAAWQPTPDGMRLVGPDGQTVLAFNRWSNSLLVTHRADGVDVQLKRGRPGA